MNELQLHLAEFAADLAHRSLYAPAYLRAIIGESAPEQRLGGIRHGFPHDLPQCTDDMPGFGREAVKKLSRSMRFHSMPFIRLTSRFTVARPAADLAYEYKRLFAFGYPKTSSAFRANSRTPSGVSGSIPLTSSVA